MASLALGYDELAAVNPGIVLASITPFGQTGPKAQWPATDITITAVSHYLLATGDASRPPVRISLPQAFLHAGAEAAIACVIALRERQSSGRGQWIDVSAQASMTFCTQSRTLSTLWGDFSPFRLPDEVRLKQIGLSATYPAKDG